MDQSAYLISSMENGLPYNWEFGLRSAQFPQAVRQILLVHSNSIPDQISMKFSKFVLAIVICTSFVIGIQAQDAKQDTAKVVKSANLAEQVAQQDEEKVQTTTGDGSLEQKASYIIGFSEARRLMTELKQQGLTIDNKFMMEGITAALEGKEAKMDGEEIRAVMTALQEKLQKEMIAKQAAKKAEGTKFLAENAKKEGVKTLERGVQYKVLKAGTGASPTADQIVSIYYKGQLIGGTVFGKTEDKQPLDRLKAGQFVPGFSMALQKMKVGGKWQFFIPAEMAYGARGQGSIGPNETLVFEVELLEIK